MIGDFITLSCEEMELAIRVGLERNEANLKRGIVDRRIGGEDGVRYNQRGVAAELAHRNKFGVEIFLLTERWDGSIDCYHDGIPVDVKETKYSFGKLLCPLHQANTKAAYFALWTSDWARRRFTFIGFCPRHVLLRPENIADHCGHGLTYGVTQDKVTTHRLPETIYQASAAELPADCDIPVFTEL